jgi:putative CocE/NonD family hydrolase
VLTSRHEGLSQPVHDVRFLHDVRTPVRDGVRLSCDVYMPKAPGPFPTILHRTPYESNAERFVRWALWWARRGYAVVCQDARGCYQSEGTFYAYRHEAEDGHDTLAWIAERDWSNGKIGTWGRSYGGLVQWDLARLGSPHLTCMAPHVIVDDYFADYHYVGGAFQLTLSLLAMICWETNYATAALSGELFFKPEITRHLPLIELDELTIGRKVPYWRDWLAHPTDGPFWRQFGTIGTYDRIAVPILQQCGWYDAYPSATLRMWNGMVAQGKGELARRNQRVLIGPWSHAAPEGSRMGEVDFGPAADLRLPEVELRWFDHWLKGVDTGMLDEPPVSLFVMGADAWRGEREWPLARTRYEPWYLHSGGRANSLHGDGRLSPEPPGGEPPDRYDYDPDRPVPSLGGNNSTGAWAAQAEEPILPGPYDQRPIERRDDVLVYTSAPLERDLELTGPVELRLYAASSARDTDFTARLCDVEPGGRALNVTEGILRARYRSGFDRQELLEPGEVVELPIRLYDTSRLFRRGHRLRLDVSSSSFPRFSRNLNTGQDVATGTAKAIARQTILHEGRYPSHLILPVVPT